MKNGKRGASPRWGFFVEGVWKAHEKAEFEPVVERRIHQFITMQEGAWHTGQRNLIWVRLSKNSVATGYASSTSEISFTTKMKEGTRRYCQPDTSHHHDRWRRRWKSTCQRLWRLMQERDRRICRADGRERWTRSTRARCVRAFAPSHVCIISPERLGPVWRTELARCGCRVQQSIQTGQTSRFEKGATIDEQKGQWSNVNQAVASSPTATSSG